jgi:hypothetical protein
MPLCTFEHGKMCAAANGRKLFRDEDREPPGPTGRAVIKDKVIVVVCCTLPLETWGKEMEGELPMQHLSPIHVHSRGVTKCKTHKSVAKKNLGVVTAVVSIHPSACAEQCFY